MRGESHDVLVQIEPTAAAESRELRVSLLCSRDLALGTEGLQPIGITNPASMKPVVTRRCLFHKAVDAARTPGWANEGHAMTSSEASIADKLSNIATTVAEVNAHADALNETIERVEKSLTGSVSFWWERGPKLCLSLYDDHTGIPARHFYQLGYAKSREGWCIAVRESEETLACSENMWSEATDADWTVVDETVIPLRHAPRLVRVEVLDQLDGFLDALYAANLELRERLARAMRRCAPCT
jgi:hypothetical protein